MIYRLIFIFLLIFFSAHAHEIEIDVRENKAVIIEIRYEEGQPFSFKEYEIYWSQQPDKPFVVGKTDRYGRVVFLPDKNGIWLLKAYSEDGHGIVKELKITDAGTSFKKEHWSLDRAGKLLAGVAIIGGFMGIFRILRKRDEENT